MECLGKGVGRRWVSGVAGESAGLHGAAIEIGKGTQSRLDEHGEDQMKPALLLLVSVLAFQTTTSAAETPPKLSSVEMEDLVAPIALYPDPLLGLILPASVFPDQIVDAALL